MKRNITPLLFGVVFILAGLGYLGSVLFDWHFTIFFDGWWTMFIIIPSFISILANGPKAFNVGAFLFGGLFLLGAQDVIPYRHFGVILVSSIVIYIGLALIIRYIRGPKVYDTNPIYNSSNTSYTTSNPTGEKSHVDSDNTYQQNSTNMRGGAYSANSDTTSEPSYNAILSGVDARNTSTDFQGAKVSAILGGVDLDLRDAIITKDVTVYATAVLGGIDILAPRNVRIVMTKTDILGGTTCTAMTMPQDSNVPIVTFNCTTVLGGIEIK